MANPPPLPPIVNGPVYTTSKQVNVNNVLPNAKVWVYNDPGSTPSSERLRRLRVAVVSGFR